MVSLSPQFLVKAHRDAKTGTLALGDSARQVALSPLLPSIEAESHRGLGVRDAPVWHLAAVEDEGANPWDLCHALLDQGLGVAGAAGIAFAEPDIEQSWIWASEARQSFGILGECGAPEPPDTDIYAAGPEALWFAGKAYSQLGDARDRVGAPAPEERVRIAHLDTGYDPGHSSTPPHVSQTLQRDFTEIPASDRASDPGAGGLNSNPGHGVGTLALLAGLYRDAQPLGGAAALEVVPLRVAKGVVLFKNSAIARALDYVHSLADDAATRIDVVSMSMGGLASTPWADATNALYDKGVVVVTAAGNNFGNLPTRYIVYPARFDRVIAACGVMADGRAYADLPFRKMAGCYGPRRKEATALSAFTPNVPWARLGCPDLFDLDGGGTSAATPQIAAAAALWVQQHRSVLDGLYPADQRWARVEALRRALFSSARKTADRRLARRLGQGTLQALTALGVAPAAVSALTRQEPDEVSFPLLRVLIGLGATERLSGAQRMLELEAVQISQRSEAVQDLLGEADPGDLDDLAAAAVDQQRLLEAIADHPDASKALKLAVARALRRDPGSGPSGGAVAGAAGAEPAGSSPGGAAAAASLPSPRVFLAEPPAKRRLRVFAFDPLMGTRLDTLELEVATIAIPWERDLKPGPVGDYFEVVDIDPASESAYLPVDLNQPAILAQDGLPPSEGSPQFHQQMVYAVAMRTVAHFEEALGRSALWAEREPGDTKSSRFEFVRRLRIYPHALREANAYYDPARRALLLGYFKADAVEAGDNLPGGTIFTCLSHDIVAHEVCHALLDGIHPYFKEPTNLDMLAFHEAFADIVALLQHFTMPEPLRHEIAKSRGDLRGGNLQTGSLLAGLASQFGQAIGARGALRSAISRFDEASGTWVRIQPSKTDYQAHSEPHARGAVLVSAVFDAFLKIYEYRIQDLLRLATGGSGVLPDGAISADLTERLAREAADTAGRVLRICIRALDYCPPIDLTFGDYLRALVTADRDVVPEDDKSYRVAFVSAFRARGIYPAEVSNLSVDGLAWQRPETFIGQVPDILAGIDLDWSLDADRADAYRSANCAARELTRRLPTLIEGGEEASRRVFGVILTSSRGDVTRTLDGVKGKVSKFRVLSVRPLRRVRADGRILNHVVIEITQRWKPQGESGFHRGGCTIVYDADQGQIRYVIRKRLGSQSRAQRQRDFRAGIQVDPYLSDDRLVEQPFAVLHRGH